MSGCSLHDAFPDTATQSGKVARKEERKKAMACKGPALAFLKGADMPDPDRPAERPYPPPAKLQGAEEYTDVIGTKPAPTGPTPSPAKAIPASQLPDSKKDFYGNKIANYFGKSETDEGFADYSKSRTDNPGYNLQPDFLGSFGAVGLEKSAGKPLLETPSINDAWKSLTPSGTRTSFFTELTQPRGGGEEWLPPRNEGQGAFSTGEKESLLKKLDVLFARLEDLESRKNEYAHTEMTMFILSGLFLLFGIESIRKLR
jgi:hypothetical protein